MVRVRQLQQALQPSRDSPAHGWGNQADDRPDAPWRQACSVAELLHVSTKTVFNMTRDGRLPARRLPGSRRYLYVGQEILELLDQTPQRRD